MDLQLAKEEYNQALKLAQKEYKELTAAGRDPYPAVLDEILADQSACTTQEVGTVEIPAMRIVGTKSAGRTAAFTANFRPLLNAGSEFAVKWVHLCAAHLGEGIREPITCFEYLGNFYVQEGNKRVSVLRHFDAPRIPGTVKRLVPPRSDDPRIKAYYEFLDFYKASKLYTVQFRRPGDYAKLLAALGKEPGEVWTDQEIRTFRAYFQYFLDAFHALNVKLKDVLPEEALLLWLQLNPYKDLSTLSAAELKKSLSALWPDVVSSTQESELKVATKPVPGPKSSILSWITTTVPDHVNAAFVHQLDTASSNWVLGHEKGRKHLEEVFAEQVTTRSYFGACTPELVESSIEQAVADGAMVVFTTSPNMIRATLKMAVKYPKIRFYNCSVNQPYSSIRTYYGRIFEAKFITGAIAGAMAQDDRIGYIASYPNFGVPASINAFALGAQLTNPRAQIELRWSCCAGTPQADFFADGIRVVSNRDVPTQDKMYLDFCNYGTYLLDTRGDLIPLGSPVWVWGKFYELVIRSMLSGVKKDEKTVGPVNYWLGMDTGVIDIELSDRLPAGVLSLAKMLRYGLRDAKLDPFKRRIIAQDGTMKNDGTMIFTPDELLKMDWLCENVVGEIPPYEEILPRSQAMVRELGLYRDDIPAVKETKA